MPKHIPFLWFLATSGLSCLPLAGQANHQVQTHAGLRFTGHIGEHQSVTRVSTEQTKIYLTPASIRSQAVVEPREKPITYRFNQEIVKGPKKGSVFLVIKDFKTGKISDTGITQVSLLDPKLGQLQFRAAITLVTPQVIRWEGIEYDFELSFVRPDLARKMVQGTIVTTDPATSLRAARFYKQAGLYSQGLQLLAPLDQQKPEVKAESSSLLRHYHHEIFTSAEILTNRGSHKKAKSLLQRLKTLDRAPLTPAQAERMEAILKSCGEVETGESWLADHLPDTTLPDAANIRLSQLLKKIDPPLLDQSTIRQLTHRWAEPMSELQLSNPQIKEAVALAKDIGIYFSKDQPDANTTLAERFAASTLPRELLVSIIRYAPAPVDQSLLRGWHRIEFDHPRSQKKFHYYVSFPPDFDPSTPAPAIFTMHGMNTKADVMRVYWGRTADTHGYIMISPEYIYDREFGLKYMDEEIYSVHGAIAHASRTLPIDSSRILLQGHSQGGHAAWEMGGILADRLSGVVPIIGVTWRDQFLTNYQKTPLYIIDGSEDGAAPKMIRESMPKLAKHKVDATYVEYTGRKHEAFYEEYPRVMQWAQNYSRERMSEVKLIALRESDFRRRWIEIHETQSPLPAENPQGLERAIVTGKVHTAKVVLKTKNVTKLALHIPLDWSIWKSLQVIVNGKSQRVKLAHDWTYLLKNAHLTGDRHILYMNQIMLSL